MKQFFAIHFDFHKKLLRTKSNFISHSSKVTTSHHQMSGKHKLVDSAKLIRVAVAGRIFSQAEL